MEKNMNMQDNELDDLFRNKLDGLEVEPSGKVWGNIMAGLDEGKKKKPLWAYISAAASILVIATAALLLIKEQEVKPEHNTQRLTKVQPINKKGDKIAQDEQQAIAQNAENSDAPVAIPVEETRKEESKKGKPAPAPARLAKARATPLKPIAGIKSKPILIAQVTPQPQQAINSPVLPDADVTLSEKTISAEPEPFKTKPVVMASAGLPQTDNVQADQPVKKKRRGFGGLLSSIVAKIDKRKDKIIEFEDNGDGQRLTGINLGIIKISTEEE
jgi:hypothetical protein